MSSCVERSEMTLSRAAWSTSRPLRLVSVMNIRHVDNIKYYEDEHFCNPLHIHAAGQRLKVGELHRRSLLEQGLRLEFCRDERRPLLCVLFGEIAADRAALVQNEPIVVLKAQLSLRGMRWKGRLTISGTLP